MRTDRRPHGQTGITKLIVAFHNFVNMPLKKVEYDGNRVPVFGGRGPHPTYFSIKHVISKEVNDNHLEISVILELNNHMTMFSQYSRAFLTPLTLGIFRLW